MRKHLQGATVALLLSGTALVTTGAANAQDNRYGHDQPNIGLSVQFGDVAVGYRDGYMDSGHNFHRWNGDSDYQAYRSRHADNYHDWNHDRDTGNGAIAVSFGDVSVGYRDGYLDSGRNFHRWNGDSDYRTYRDQHGSSYHDWNHDRGGSTITIGFGGIAFGYRDGYWDTGHHWHHWRHRNDYRSYRDQSGSNYQDTYHYREDNNGWRQH